MNSRLVVMLLSASFVAPVSATEAGVDLLLKMNNALHGMDYSGTLVHIKGDDVNTLRVEHEVINGVESETITSLNNTKDTVSAQRHSFSLAIVPDSVEKMQKVYSLDVGAMKKVAKRECQILVARPKDKMRYLQKYCIDKATGLPLDYSLIDKKHKAIERFTFTNVDITAATSSAAVGSVSARVPAVASEPVGDWSIDNLPNGFHFGKAFASQKAEIQKGPNTEHFVITDGLSSISVFISPITTVEPKSISSLSSGALNVLTSQKNKHRITLVGEVPRTTMQTILSNLKYQGKP